MAETSESEPVPSSSEHLDSDIKDDAPLAKKRKLLSEKEQSEKLEHRLGGILCCAVCLDLPPAAVYQCTNGHLMCAPCFTHLLADARLRDEAATCPNCRVEISKTSASRNLAVEKTVSELPSECRYCTHVYPRHALQHHEDSLCEERRYKFSQIVVDGAPCWTWRPALDDLLRMLGGVHALLLGALRRAYLVSAPVAPCPSCPRRRYVRLTGCKFACIGCGWRGPAHEASAHEAGCECPARSAADLLALLAERERRARDATAVYEQIFDLLSYEKITFNDLQLKPYRTEEFVHKLYYETSRFSAFGHQWVVKAFVNKNQRDPTQSSQREITYQLLLKSKATAALNVQWLCARGPWGEARLAARVAAHCFRDDAPDAPPLPLPLAEPRDANRLLATKPLHCRLIMFLSTK
ncbi:zinc finger TRAF-type-containing protein 1 homolog isoform X2 [Battus philenor]|uniref:zinc finger TRAF-type-containing protein 1 homolog isoform X2 n=1 Tax=Battus philenor TaxID=42288 RepID=UPI0035D07180